MSSAKIASEVCREEDDEVRIYSSSSSSSSSHLCSSKNESTVNDGSTIEERYESREIRAMIRKESENVFMWREIVSGMLIITAVLVTMTTCIFFIQEDVEYFSTRFYEDAHAIVDSTHQELKLVDKSMKLFADLMVTYAGGANKTWPFVTIASFAKHAANIRTIAEHPVIWSAAIVADATQRTAWEMYAQSKDPTLTEPQIWEWSGGSTTPQPLPQDATGPFHPIWQNYDNGHGAFTHAPTNYNLISMEGYTELLSYITGTGEGAMSQLMTLKTYRDAYQNYLVPDEPLSMVVQPILPESAEEATTHLHDLHGSYPQITDTMNSTDGSDEMDLNTSSFEPVASLQSIVQWRALFSNILQEGEDGVYCIVKNSCGQNFTFLLMGKKAVFQGYGADFHEKEFEEQYKVTTILTDSVESPCSYELSIYPSTVFRVSKHSDKAKIFTVSISVIFCFITLAFFAYDRFVKKRNDKVVRAAARSSAIVSSLFPSNVRDRLYQEEDAQLYKKKKYIRDGRTFRTSKAGLQDFLHDEAIHDEGADLVYNTKPVADLFPDVTILFADLVGFTAWSSSREPSQVFILLETLYHNFDNIARRRRIFKIETVGDCYVAAAGLPDPRPDHAVAIAKFASDILKKTHDLTKKLEMSLGPDTGDLTLRVGLHSGPVTAGVLRGERSRFQLFGDTMNTGSRMESNGAPNKIQCSQETADLITIAGKTHWLRQREDKISAKGKGLLTTYWVEVKGANAASSGSSESKCSGDGMNHNRELGHFLSKTEIGRTFDASGLTDKTQRLINWTVELLYDLIMKIVARYGDSRKTIESSSNVDWDSGAATPMEDVQEIICLPEFDAAAVTKQTNTKEIVLPAAVSDQLEKFVANIAMLYNDNPFHNFEHASHVALSVAKLLSRIVAPTDTIEELHKNSEAEIHSTLHDHTYGIISDPLTQFACIFSSLIHDVDHLGVPNAQLMKENPALSQYYKNQSIAEQNSIDVSWSLLMKDEYSELRKAICPSQVELTRFRQLVVNSVLATDIVDKDLKKLRNERWDRAFEESVDNEDTRTVINRKATIVIEHIIQASDVAHTMQHWQVYRKWNERFFIECYQAYLSGRAEKDPSEFWYKGEIGFFDFYIIPLAKKLKECGVFGVSSDEYLNYAMKNKREWEERGEEIVAEMKEKVGSQRQS